MGEKREKKEEKSKQRGGVGSGQQSFSMVNISGWQ